ncbi:MAG: hypothetical protein AAFV53_34990 [Myxococcota bacterium]
MVGAWIGVGIWLATAAAEDNKAIAADIARRMERTGPHLARYVKAGTEDEALMIAYRSPGSISMRVQSEDNDVAMSVQGDEIQIRIAEECAVVPMREVLRAIDATRLASDVDPSEILGAQLDYRLTAAGEVNFNVVFRRGSFETPLQWISILGHPETVIEKGPERTWAVRSGDLHYTLSRKTGVLESMSIQGADETYAIELASMVPLQDAEDTERARCQQSTDARLVRTLTGQLLMQAYIESYPPTLEAMKTRDPTTRAAAAARQVDFWVTYQQQDLEDWLAMLAQKPEWRALMLTYIGDRDHYASFRAGLPPSVTPEQAMAAYQEAWREELLVKLCQEYANNLEGIVLPALAREVTFDDATLIQEMISIPIAQAIAQVAPTVMAPFIDAVVQAGIAPLAQPPSP